MGRQLKARCLPIGSKVYLLGGQIEEEMFNFWGLVEVQRVPGVEPSPAFVIKLSTGLSTGCAGGRGYPQAQKSRPPCVKSDGVYIHTPQRKIYAKVRSRKMSYFVHIFLVTLVTKRK
jgi:hypothetical protein